LYPDVLPPPVQGMLPSYTLRLILRTDKKNADDLCPVAVCITSKGKRKYVSTGIRVTEDQWKDGRVRNHANATLHNQAIAKALAEVEAEYLAGGGGDGRNIDFLKYAGKVLSEFQIAHETWRCWDHHYRVLCYNFKQLTFGDITPVWLHRYNKRLITEVSPVSHRVKEEDRKPISQNSARKAFVFMKRVFNEARADGTTTLYPFRDWKIPSETREIQEYLTMDELDRLEAVLKKKMPTALRTTIAHFLLECYSGIRHSDWSKWQTERISGSGERESFYLTTTKTGEPIYLPLQNSPRLKAVVDHIREHELTYNHSNQDANRRLKLAAVMAGIEKNLTTHVGRHTAGTLLLEKGFSYETVAEVLGVSMDVVRRYAKVTRRKVQMEYELRGGL
jgi:integrase/recombinase XerD